MLSIVLGIIRHTLTTLGGGMVGAGALTSDDLQSAVGAICTVLGIAWSVWEKRASLGK